MKISMLVISLLGLVSYSASADDYCDLACSDNSKTPISQDIVSKLQTLCLIEDIEKNMLGITPD